MSEIKPKSNYPSTTFLSSSSTSSLTSCISEIDKWSIAQVISYLKNDIDSSFDDEDISIIEKHKIDGNVLLHITKEEIKDTGLSIGPIVKIINVIEKIKRDRISANKKIKRSYSSYKKIEEVFQKYNIKASNISRIPTFEIGKVEINNHDINFQHCLKDIKLWIEYMGPANEQNEAARCQFISCILLAAVRYFKNLLIYPQLEVIGDEETGRVDYAINEMKSNGDDELICITEGKQSDIKSGIGQNILHLDSAIQVC